MPGGRPPLRAKLVERAEGSQLAKDRLRLVLETLSGERTIPSVCEELGICEAMFHKLRKRFIQESVEGFEERVRGVKPKYSPEVRAEIEELNRRNEELQKELRLARVKEEIALAVARPAVSVSPSKKGSRAGR